MILAARPAIEMPNLIGWRFFQHGFYRSIERRFRHLCLQHFGRMLFQVRDQLFIGRISCCAANRAATFFRFARGFPGFLSGIGAVASFRMNSSKFMPFDDSASDFPTALIWRVGGWRSIGSAYTA